MAPNTIWNASERGDKQCTKQNNGKALEKERNLPENSQTEGYCYQ